jgi:hypothetical protein
MPSVLIKVPGPWKTEWTPPEDLQITAAPSEEGAQLTLDRVAQLDDGYIFYATFYFHDAAYHSVWPGWYTLLDANGREIPNEDVSDEVDEPDGPHLYPIALKAQAPLPPGPVTVSVDDVDVKMSVDASFSFDAGPDPQIGQEWTLNQKVEVEGYTLTIQAVRAVQERGYPSYEFSILTNDDAIVYVMVTDLENPVSGSGGGSGAMGPITTQIYYQNALPAGLVTISITELALALPGPWQAAWIPSEELQVTANPPEQAACLTYETWVQAQAQAPIIPGDLGGKIMRFGPIGENQEDWVISISQLDGSEMQVLDASYHSSLSPDGTRLAYTGVVDELSILDLAIRQTTSLPGTGRAYYEPHWSPDGTQIAFVRLVNDFNLFVINADGTGLQQLTQSVVAEELIGWLPDGKHILYALNGADGKSLYQMDIKTREVEPLFTGREATQGDFSVSPDGNRLAYVEDIFGDQLVLYVSDLDGSNPQPIIDIYPAMISAPVWGSNPEWLLIQVFDPEVSILLSTPVLVNLETCQVIVLSNLPGEVISWEP